MVRITLSPAPALRGGAIATLGIALVAVLGAVGCAHVAPYEREHLAKPNMDLKREELRNRFYAHVYDAREGAMGSTDSAGGGCGCN